MLSVTERTTTTHMHSVPERSMLTTSLKRSVKNELDTFEEAGAQDNTNLVKKLRAENEMLRTRIEDLERQLQIAQAIVSPGVAIDNLESVRNKRSELFKTIAEVQAKLELAQRQYSDFLKAADDPEKINWKAAEINKPKLLAKRALQNEATAFEEQNIKPLNDRLKELQDELSQSARGLTAVTRPVVFETKVLISELSHFLLRQPESKAIRAAINPKPGITPRNLKELLRPQVAKFLEGKRPPEIPLYEWVHYLGASQDETSKAVLNHFGVNVESILSAVEIAFSKSNEWKDEHPAGFRMLR